MNTFVLEPTEQGDMPVDIYQKLSDDRILFLSDHITDKTATDIVSTLMLRDSENCNEKITLFINSEGGDIRNVMMIYDVIQMIQSPVETVCIGSALDEAALLLASGAPGMRLATKNSVIAVSQLINDWMSLSDLTNAKIVLEQSISDNKKMMEIIAKACHKPLKEVMTYFNRRVFMTANQAVKYGLIDKVIAFNK